MGATVESTSITTLVLSNRFSRKPAALSGSCWHATHAALPLPSMRCLWFHGPVPVEPVAVLTASLKADADLRNRAYQDQLEYVSAVSAEGHANADLTGSSFDGMRRDSVEFDRSQS